MGEIKPGEVGLAPARTCGHYDSVRRKLGNQFVVGPHSGLDFDTSLVDRHAKELDELAVNWGRKRRKACRASKSVGGFEQSDSVTPFGCNPRALHAAGSGPYNDHVAR